MSSCRRRSSAIFNLVLVLDLVLDLDLDLDLDHRTPAILAMV